MKIDKKTSIAFYTNMVRIRHFEQRIQDLYAKGLVPGLAHLSIGQEAVAVGACAVLREDDYINPTHRGHGQVIVKGADLKPMMAELFGKKTGYCKGKGGSMHIGYMEKGILGPNGIAGGQWPIATGVGLSAKIRRTDQVILCFGGDGASNNGTFHEALNFAALHKLPVIYILVNNGYQISLPQAKQHPIKDIAMRAAGYAMPGVVVDGNDVFAVYEATSKAVKRARAGKGPSLVECKTYRWRGHHEGDPNQGERYRTREEIERWKKKDPIKQMAGKLLADKILTKGKIAAIEKEVIKEIDEAVAFANESEFPTIEEMYEDIYV
ncbi:MAG: thiamine pyrophosphate-dependent dehydrogenase E1 component subunit alpha [Deltaproteobacteria bacterium]|nr:thiamine pyrophosphate-dependent dehydrogenase E1 component subunit alpha [Deltaproteobacteria bacterium]